jgi:hypothetical protein
MASKTIKNEQWYVKDLVARIAKGEICKPKFQRKRKWDILPKKDTIPSERNYIDFLRETKNSVHPITFGLANAKYTNIDGNNRINAIVHFVKNPFDIYPEYLELINNFLTAISSLQKNILQDLLGIFSKMSYADIMNYKTLKKYFTETINEEDIYTKYLKGNTDEFEPIIDKLQKELSNGTDRFDYNVTINVNIFEGYSTEELCNMFSKINKHSSALTARELLASILFTKTDFVIEDKVFEAELRQILIENYTQLHNSEGEILELYNFDENAPINAYDFIIGFELIAFNKSKIINNKSVGVSISGLSVFFKVFNTIYDGLNDKFTSANVNDFIKKINEAINILNKVERFIAIENITSISPKIFSSCHKKIMSLNTNNQTILLLSVIGLITNFKILDTDIVRFIRQLVLGHFMITEIHSKEQRDMYYRDDIFSLDCTSGTFVRELFTKIYKTPQVLMNKLTKHKMSNILDILIQENVNTDISPPKNRRTRKFWEGALIQSYYNIKMPQLFLNKKYWIEHIFPFSSIVEPPTSVIIDIDRLGNIIPIIDEINSKRGNKHIREYSKLNEGTDFIKHLSDIIPPSEAYDTIITHASGPTPPKIINPAAYSALCSANEKKYRDIFLNQLYPEQNS